MASAAQARDTAAFGDLIERYADRMLRYSQRILYRDVDHEDLVQEIFLQAFRNLRAYDSGRPFSTWLYRVAHNVLVNQLRKRSREPLVLIDSDTILPRIPDPEDVEDRIDRTLLREQLDRGLADLDPRYRIPLVLYYFEDLAYGTIAEILRVPVGTVSARITRGRVQLRRVLERKGYHP